MMIALELKNIFSSQFLNNRKKQFQHATFQSIKNSKIAQLCKRIFSSDVIILSETFHFPLHGGASLMKTSKWFGNVISYFYILISSFIIPFGVFFAYWIVILILISLSIFQLNHSYIIS